MLLVISCIVGCTQNGTQPPQTNNSSDIQSPSSSPPADEKVLLTIGGAPATANIYAYWVAVAKGLNEEYENFNVTVTEGSGSLDSIKRLRTGEADFVTGTATTDVESYFGTGNFEGDPFEEQRTFWYYDKAFLQILVSEESGVETVYDLTGKKYSAGGTGMAMAKSTLALFEYLGVYPDYYEAAKADAGDAYTNRQIVGITSSAAAPDSFVLQLTAAVPGKFLQWPLDKIDELVEKFPDLSKGVLPGATYEFMTEDRTTLCVLQGCMTTTKLSQEIGYKIIKNVNEYGRKYWESASASAANANFIENTLATAIPLHAGTVQYFTELGVDIPEHLIPPEYIPVS